MARSLVQVECGKCQHPALIKPADLDSSRCPSCQWIDWMELYKLTYNDKKFLADLRIEPTEETR
jgi:hypothetical protein